jgi:hypothetical protein
LRRNKLTLGENIKMKIDFSGIYHSKLRGNRCKSLCRNTMRLFSPSHTSFPCFLSSFPFGSIHCNSLRRNDLKFSLTFAIAFRILCLSIGVIADVDGGGNAAGASPSQSRIMHHERGFTMKPNTVNVTEVAEGVTGTTLADVLARKRQVSTATAVEGQPVFIRASFDPETNILHFDDTVIPPDAGSYDPASDAIKFAMIHPDDRHQYVNGIAATVNITVTDASRARIRK